MHQTDFNARNCQLRQGQFFLEFYLLPVFKNPAQNQKESVSYILVMVVQIYS